MTPVTTIMADSTQQITESFKTVHGELMRGGSQARQQAWEEQVGILADFDLNDPGDQIKAKAVLSGLDQVLYASYGAGGESPTKF